MKQTSSKQASTEQTSSKQARYLSEGDKFRLVQGGHKWTVIENFGDYVTCYRNHGFLGISREIKSIHYQAWVYPE